MFCAAATVAFPPRTCYNVEDACLFAAKDFPMMNRLVRFLSIALLLLASRSARCADAIPLASGAATLDGALTDYVGATDDSFGWTVRRQGKLPVGEWAELTLT